MHALRASVALVGAAGAVFGLAAAAVGPLGGALATTFAWALVFAAVGAVGTWAWRAFAPLRGAGVARLLGRVAPELRSAARSAYELERDPPAHASSAMLAAHAAQVERELRFIRPSHVVPWRELRHRAVGLGVMGLALAGALLASERGSAGAYALVHPGERDAEGERVAVAFSDVSARLTYPSYLRREPVEIRDFATLEVPRGTTVELRAKPRIEASEATLRTGDVGVPMERDPEGHYFARFVAREDTPLGLRLRNTDGEWVRDAIVRSVRALSDEAPTIALSEPTEDLVVDELEEIALFWDATDDVGLATVELVVNDANGQEHRRRVATYGGDDPPETTSGEGTVDLALYALAPGESVTVWLEARDGDVVNGPNHGVSRELTITVASEATRRDERLAGLEALLDRGLHTLADRIEGEEPEEEEGARARFARLDASTEGFARALAEEADAMRGDAARQADVGLVREMASRVRRLLHQERVAHGRRLAPHRARRTLDERFGTELEDDSLTLDDLLQRARIADAAAIARELESIRREIGSLLAELQRTDSPEARRQLIAAIARAERRLHELRERMGQMGTEVPQEFMNRQELSATEMASNLAELREAAERGDLDRAEELVARLRREIDALARELGRTGEEHAEARFGPRDRAWANAMEGLEELEGAQQGLANRGTARRSNAARRAFESIGGRDNRIGRRLGEDMEAVRESLNEIDRRHLASFEEDGYDRARARLTDARDALRAGDLAEAMDMADVAARDVSRLARDLELSALMFPGHEGETSSDASHARRTDTLLDGIRRRLDEAVPDVAEHVDPADRSAMRGDRERQHDAFEAAQGLAGRFAEGPDGAPLSEDAARELAETAAAMRRAEGALGGGDPVESARSQEEAARRLSELLDQLQQEQQSGGGGGGGGSSSEPTRPVDIPNADEFEGPMEMRRRLLDAMQESAPAGYEDSVRRYYEGLLR